MSRKRFRSAAILPAIISLIAFAIFFSTTNVLHADSNETLPSIPPNNFTINGRIYKENGIIFDVPEETDSSRNATVVSFLNNVVIPSYINVGGIQYTVTKIYKAPNVWLGDTSGWVTLPPTLKDCSQFPRYAIKTISSPTYLNFYNTIGVTNINVTDLDAFLMSDFKQWLSSSEHYTGGIKPDDKYWKLYLNGKQVHDIVYPEGSPIKTNLLFAEGINSITIPASDTTRRTSINWYCVDSTEKSTVYYRNPPKPKKIQFKADSGYDLRYYNIEADSIVLPKGLTEFKGLGTISLERFKGIKVAKWPDNLKSIYSTYGLAVTHEELPNTIIKVGDIAEKILYFPS